VERTLSRAQARSFYDAFGAKQDAQGFYEDPPNRELAAQLELGNAGSLLEFGCGTGRLAAQLLGGPLGASARYLGLDQSHTMAELARARLAPFGARARVEQTDGSMQLPAADGSADRFLSTYVLDLLSHEDIAALVDEAARVLRPGGLAGLSGLVPGRSPWARCVTALWRAVHRWDPARVGGCRPLELAPFFPGPLWEVCHASRHSWRGLTSGVLVLRRR
jgi:SAM-dependent methyltransferase